MWDGSLVNPWDQQYPCPAGFSTMVSDRVVVGVLAGPSYATNVAANSNSVIPILSLIALASATAVANMDGVVRKVFFGRAKIYPGNILSRVWQGLGEEILQCFI